jgi:hypothetical protein
MPMCSKWSPSFKIQYHNSLYIGFPSLISNFLIKLHSNFPSKCETLFNCNLLTFTPRSCQHLTQQTCRRTTFCAVRSGLLNSIPVSPVPPDRFLYLPTKNSPCLVERRWNGSTSLSYITFPLTFL